MRIPLRGAKVPPHPDQAPLANAYDERFVGMFPGECLDRILIARAPASSSVRKSYVEHYNDHRPVALWYPPVLRFLSVTSEAPPRSLLRHERDRDPPPASSPAEFAQASFVEAEVVGDLVDHGLTDLFLNLRRTAEMARDRPPVDGDLIGQNAVLRLQTALR
jgi:hypothetical protein